MPEISHEPTPGVREHGVYGQDMPSHEEFYHERLTTARKRHKESLEALAKVRLLLAKADVQYRRDPASARKWHKVLENLEASLDECKSRVNVTEVELRRLEAKSAAGGLSEASEEVSKPTPPSDIDMDSPWPAPMNLEEACLLQEKIDAGEIHDKHVEAELELSNQLGENYEPDESGKIPRRQHVLRGAIDKISRRDYDGMSYDEVKIVLACESLLTSRLEPTPRDERLKRIIAGASRVLRQRKAAFESDPSPPSEPSL